MPLDKNADAGDYVRDFAKSKAPQFKGKSKKKRQQMAIAAYLDAKGPKESTMKTFDQIRSSLQEKKVDEISSNKLGDYMTKSAADAAKRGPEQSARRQDKRIAGQSMADKKIRKKMGYSSDAKVPAGMNEAATDLGTIHVIHHPTKGYRQKGGGYSKEINRKTKTFKSHDTAAKSDNSALHYQHHDDPKTGKQHTSYHPSTNRGTRVHTVNTATGEVKKGDYLHHHQATAAQKLAKKNNSSEFPTRAGKTHLDDIPKSKRFDHGTQKGHYVESVKSADKKPEKYVDAQGKTKIRMVPVDRNMGEDKAADRAALQKAMDVFKKRGGKITKVAPGKAAGYHGKDDPGKDMKGMMDKGDTKAIGTRKKVKSMGESMLGQRDAARLNGGQSKDPNFNSPESHIDYHHRRSDGHKKSGGEADRHRYQVAKKLGYNV